MKKILITLAIIIAVISLNKSETTIIPKESIRFRVIASSNSAEDQNVKKEVVKELKEEINQINLIPKDIIQNRKIIQENIPNIKNRINSTLTRLNVKEDYSINYGINYFPEKEYKNIIYEEGEYESLVVTLGDGKGDNFWCVLFPPLCLLEGEDNENEEVEYTSFIKEIIDKYF